MLRFGVEERRELSFLLFKIFGIFKIHDLIILDSFIYEIFKSIRLLLFFGIKLF